MSELTDRLVANRNYGGALWDATPLADRWCLNAWKPSGPCPDGHEAADGAPHYCDRLYKHPGRCRCTCGATTTKPAPIVEQA